MYDANEIGLDWKGTLETLSSVPQSRCCVAGSDGILKDHTGRERCTIKLEDVVIDSTMGKLRWATRTNSTIIPYKQDFLVKCPTSQIHCKQEAVIQWLCQKALAANGLGEHCPRVYDIFKSAGTLWFTMSPIYRAPILNSFLSSLPSWQKKHSTNGQILLKIICQVAMCCLVLEQTIGFNHRDMKPDNLLIKTDDIKSHRLNFNDLEVTVAPSPTVVLVDFGFSCLGPGKIPWIQAGDDVLSPFDACPKVGRDIFMLIVFLIWRPEIRQSLTDEHLDFLKSSLHLSTERWKQMLTINSSPVDWIYVLITERGFQCPALDPLTWLQSCATKFPELVSMRNQSASKTLSNS
jgi:serine/threonine protein kinase